MSEHKISDAEWKVMNIIWSNKSINAREIVDRMKELEEWNKNTTYTVLNRLIQKEMIKREEPNFQCIPLVSKEDVRYKETRTFLEKVYDGSLKMLVSSFLSKEKLTAKEIEEIKKIIDSKDSNE